MTQGALARGVNRNKALTRESGGLWLPLAKIFPSKSIKSALAAEIIPPGLHGACQRQCRSSKNPPGDGARHHIGRSRAERRQIEMRLAQWPAAGRRGKHHVAVE